MTETEYRVGFKDRILTVNEASDYMDVSPFWLRKQARNGNIKALKICRRYIFLESDILDYLDERNGE